jgi:hypothetical protein
MRKGEKRRMVSSNTNTATLERKCGLAQPFL